MLYSLNQSQLATPATSLTAEQSQICNGSEGRRCMRHIGIVAVSAEGAALCYRTICLEGSGLLGPHNHPEISLHCFPLSSYQHLIDGGLWDAVGQQLLESAARLMRAGAELLICPDNTVHQGLDLIRASSPVPWI